MSGYCVTGEHTGCPDTRHDNFVCEGPCHIPGDR